MTIIVYRDGVIAADTQVVGGEDPGYRVGFGPKVHKIKGGLVAYAGCSGASLSARRWLEGGRKGDIPASPDGCVIWFPDGGGISLIGDGMESVVDFDAPYFAWGSGEPFALAAMWMGADASKAVEAAIAYDLGCGGKVMTFAHDARLTSSATLTPP